jgi:hypothetical protein
MRFYTQQHRFYCGVDLHARTMYLCILDGAGLVVYDKNLAADAVSAKEVDSDARAMREEEEILQISRCALLTGRP